MICFNFNTRKFYIGEMKMFADFITSLVQFDKIKNQKPHKSTASHEKFQSEKLRLKICYRIPRLKICFEANSGIHKLSHRNRTLSCWILKQLFLLSSWKVLYPFLYIVFFGINVKLISYSTPTFWVGQRQDNAIWTIWLFD